MPGQRVVQGERRVVTILFCDVKDSTAMAEQLDPEEWAEIMNEAFRYLTEPVHRYGGTVARLMGDGILAFFGAPEAHEDDPQRAVLSGLTILKEIDPFCNVIKDDYGLEFNVRVGIHTGTVVVGEIGTDQAMEYTAMGDAVNVASRMEATAQPGTVQISEDTQKLIAPLFNLKALGEIEVKGKSGAVPVFQVLTQKEQPGSLRGIEGLYSPLVGRGEEAAILSSTLDDLSQNRGGIVNIIGEAGLGKSRLIQEAREYWTNELHHDTWTESRGISYDSTRPYSLFINFIHESFNIDPNDDPSTIRSKIAFCLDDWSSEQRKLVAKAIELLLAVHEDEDSQANAEALQREFTAAIRSVWKESALRKPSVVVFDDLHWADPTSVNILGQLFSLTDEVPVLFICAMRPYRRSSGWGIKNIGETEYPHRYSEIELKPLTDDDSDILIGNLLTVSELPIDLRQLILKKAEGNPFFVEEVIRTLIDEGAIHRDEDGLYWETTRKVDDISLPDNLQALLIARIDRLDSDVRRTLQLASVIGRSFLFRILESIHGATDELNRQLGGLQRVELIREAVRVPELEYMFLHEITRDAAYETILRRERKRFHLSVGETIEEFFSDRLDDEAHILAKHFYEAGDPQKAFDYYIMAGDHARRLYANSEAIQAYTKAIELIDRIDLDEERLVYLYKHRGRTYELINQYDNALDNYRALGELGKDRGSRHLELTALLQAGTIYSTPTEKANAQLGRKIDDEALALAQELQDPEGEAKALWNLLLLEGVIKGNEKKSVVFGEQSLQIARQHDLREQLAYTLHDLARMYAAVGRIDDARSAANESEQIWIELDNQTMLGNSYSGTAFMHYGFGELEEALESARQGLQISQAIGSLWVQCFSYFTMGIAQVEQAKFYEGIQALTTGLPLGRQAHVSPQYIGFMACAASWAYCYLGDYEEAKKLATIGLDVLPYVAKVILALIHYLRKELIEAENYLTEVFDNIDELRNYRQPSKSFALAIMGEMVIEIKDDPSFRDLLQEVMDDSDNIFNQVFLADFLQISALQLMKLGKFDEAAKILIDAEKRSRMHGSNRSLLSILVTRYEVEKQLGHEGEAESAQDRAKELIDFISGQDIPEELRQSFLDTPKVKVVLQ